MGAFFFNFPLMQVGRFVFGIGGWAWAVNLSGAVLAAGQVVVEGSLRRVQHPTGGVVGQIFVAEGQAVAAGDVLLRLDDTLTPRATLTVKATAADGSVKTFSARCRIDTPEEMQYYKHGGILPYVLRSLVGK